MTDWIETLTTTPLGAIFMAGMGLIWGSFFNVCIIRVPHEQSLMPRSRCPKCSAPIPWYLNIPVFSYLALRGKCRECKAHISIQYPLVEIATSLLFLWLYLHFGINVRLLAYTIFLSLLLVISVIDLYHQIIPDEMSLPGILIGFGFCFLTHDVTWQDSVLGAFVGGGIFLMVALLYEKLAGREGLGGGDVKLLAPVS